MKALVLEKKDEFPVLKKVEEPKASGSESIVELKYSALNHRDVWITKGLYPKIKEGAILGSDGMGYIDSRRVLINPGMNWGEVQRHQSSNFEVLGMPSNGTFAEKISIDDQYIFDVPEHLSDAEAAALPLGGVTAYRTLFTRCDLEATDKVLINGTGGGVAHFALLFALAKGAQVYVTSGSDQKIQKAKELGAYGGINYNSADHVEALHESVPSGFNVIIDSAAGKPFKNLIKLCAPGARIGIYGGTLGKISEINPQVLFWRQISILGSTMGSKKDFKDMLDFVAASKLQPMVDIVIPLSNAKKGFERLEEFEQFGKVVFDNNA